MTYFLKAGFTLICTLFCAAFCTTAYAHSGHTAYVHSHLLEFGLVGFSLAAAGYYFFVISPNRAVQNKKSSKRKNSL